MTLNSNRYSAPLDWIGRPVEAEVDAESIVL